MPVWYSIGFIVFVAIACLGIGYWVGYALCTFQFLSAIDFKKEYDALVKQYGPGIIYKNEGLRQSYEEYQPMLSHLSDFKFVDRKERYKQSNYYKSQVAFRKSHWYKRKKEE